jgi:predicted ribosome quality control (RQC) complex YloA/Tae2 family protein
MGSKFRQFITPNGVNVIVGSNCHENDELTFVLGKVEELWFHVSGYPGSHVLLQTKNPSSEDIQYAANLAVKYSKMKRAVKARVDYCRIGDVSKPKGAKPGMVEITNSNSITGIPLHLTLNK